MFIQELRFDLDLIILAVFHVACHDPTFPTGKCVYSSTAEEKTAACMQCQKDIFYQMSTIPPCTTSSVWKSHDDVSLIWLCTVQTTKGRSKPHFKVRKIAPLVLFSTRSWVRKSYLSRGIGNLWSGFFFLNRFNLWINWKNFTKFWVTLWRS